MSQDYLARIAALEDALRQKDSQLSLVAETESFLRSALARAEEKIENEEREIEHLRAQIEKLRRMLFGTRSEKLRRQVEEAEALLKQQEQQSDRYNGRDNDPLVTRQLRQSRHRRPLLNIFPVRYTGWSHLKQVARNAVVIWSTSVKSARSSWSWSPAP